MNKPIHPAVAEHVMEENERLREALRATAKASCAAEVGQIVDAALSQQAEPCQDCDNFGDVHGPDGEYIGRCKCGKSEPAPAQSETNDQIAAIMLLHGTPGQQAEAARYAGLPAPAQDEREAFEQHYHRFDLSRDPVSGAYLDSEVRCLWDAWQARATRPAQTAPQQGVQLADTRRSRIYLAGPMTGIADYNFPAFNAEADRLREQGYHVENPADHGVVEGGDWADYLRYDIGRLATCECIHLLPGWSQSSGAKLEVSIAKALGMHILYAEGAETAPQPEQDERALCSEERPCIPCFTDNGGCAAAGSEELEKELFEAFWERRHGKKPVRYPGGQCVSDSALWAEIAWNERAALSAQGASK